MVAVVKAVEDGGVSREEIKGHDVTGVVLEEPSPSLRRRLAMLGHIFDNGRFGYVMSQ